MYKERTKNRIFFRVHESTPASTRASSAADADREEFTKNSVGGSMHAHARTYPPDPRIERRCY